MPIKLVIPTVLRQHANDRKEIELDARTVGDALHQLVSGYPALKRYLYSDGDRLRDYINVYVNDEDIRTAEGESTGLKDGDVLLIVPAVAGGSTAPSDLPQGYQH